MGVDVTGYLVYGKKFSMKEWEALTEDIDYDFEDEISGTPDAKFDVIEDSMMGKYVVIGRIMGSLSRYDGEDFQEISMTPDYEAIDSINEKLGTKYLMEDFNLILFNNFY